MGALFLCGSLNKYSCVPLDHKTHNICARGQAEGGPPPQVLAPSSLCNEAASPVARLRTSSPASALPRPLGGTGFLGRFRPAPCQGVDRLTKRQWEPPAALGCGGHAPAWPSLPLPLLWTRIPFPMCQESGGRGVHQPPNWFQGWGVVEGGEGEAEARAKGTSFSTGHPLK